MHQGSLEDKIWFSDRGINELIKEGLLAGISRDDIQAMTVDIRAKTDHILGAFQRILLHYQEPIYSSTLEIFGDIRSSVRRKNIQGYHAPRSNGFLLINPTARVYKIKKGAAFAQIYIGSRHEELKGFPHGVVLLNDEEIKDVILNGFLTIKPKPSIKNGYIWLHVNNTVRYMPNWCKWEWGIQEIPHFKEEPIDEGIDCKCHTAFNIWLQEEVSLSPYIGLQLYYANIPTNASQLGGVVDPGYEGGLMAQPIFDDAINIHKNQPLVRARVLYFPEGVENPYNSKKGKNHFQGTKLQTKK